MNTLLTGVLSGIVSGLISSGIFYWLLYRTKPKVEISPCICKTQRVNSGYYGIKVINRCKYPIQELRAELILMEPFNSHGGTNYRGSDVELRKNKIAVLEGFGKRKQDAAYALIFTTKEDISGIWNADNQVVIFRLTAKHSVSGFSKVFVQKYYSKGSCIKAGMFNFGNTFDIS